MKFLLIIAIAALALPFAPEAIDATKPIIREYKQWVKENVHFEQVPSLLKKDDTVINT